MAKVRVSVANLVPCLRVVETGEEVFFGLLNPKATAKAGRPVYSALGGAAEVTSGGKQYLEQQYGAEFQEGMDARLVIDAEHLGWVLEFFERHNPGARDYSQDVIETDPAREIREELVDEFPILSAEDLATIRVEYAKTVRQASVPGVSTSARERADIPSQRLFHLFQLVVPQAVAEKIFAAEAVRQLTRRDVATTRGGAFPGFTADGAILGDNIVW